MFEAINNAFDMHQSLLNLYAQRQEILSSNIANSDTPNYKSVDINFKDEIKKIFKKKNNNVSHIKLKTTVLNHLNIKTNNCSTIEVISTDNDKKSFNGNTVNMNRERIEFIKNFLKYEEQLIYLKHDIKNMMRVIKG